MGVAVRLEHSHGQSRVVRFLLFLFLMEVSGYDIGGARIVRRHLRILTGETRRTDRGLLGLGSQVWRECYLLRRMAERRELDLARSSVNLTVWYLRLGQWLWVASLHRCHLLVRRLNYRLATVFRGLPEVSGHEVARGSFFKLREEGRVLRDFIC